MPILQATLETESEMILVPGQPRELVHKASSPK
jgi:hypothetical protein